MKFALSLLLLTSSFSTLSALADDAVQARPADELVDGIGVNTHFGYTDRPYATHFDDVATRLGELGVRHIRDGVDARPAVAAHLRTLQERFGIRVLQIVGPRLPSPRPWTGKLDASKIDGILGIIRTRYATSNEAIEGPNEYDNTFHNTKPEADDADWPATLKTYTEALYEKVKADPVLKDRPVIGPSMAHAGNAPKVPDLSAFITFGNFHPYPGGWNPSRQMDDYNLPKTRQMTGSRVLWATETGYQNAMSKPADGHNPAPENVSGKYGLRLVAEYFRRGIGRTYFYEFLDQRVDLADQEANFGLLHNDLTPKPIYSALKAMIELLKDPGGPFTPGTLAFKLSPDRPEIRRVLLQKRDGAFYLLLWQETACYDAVKRKELKVPAQDVVITLPSDVQKANTYIPGISGTRIVESFEHKSAVTIKLADDLVVIELRAATHR